jgi:phage terminase small subunit
MAELTAKQQAFVREYLVDNNATQAAIRAGYSARTANREGSRLLSKPVIQAALSIARTEMYAAVVKRTAITRADGIGMAMLGVEGARVAEQWAAYRSSVELVAKLHGYITDKRETRVIRSVEDLTDDELGALRAVARSGRRE